MLFSIASSLPSPKIISTGYFDLVYRDCLNKNELKVNIQVFAIIVIWRENLKCFSIYWKVPLKDVKRDKELPSLTFKEFSIQFSGNLVSETDIVFSCFGKYRLGLNLCFSWSSRTFFHWIGFSGVTAKKGVEAQIRAYTIDKPGIQLRRPSLLPNIFNLCNFSKDNLKKVFSAKHSKPQFEIKEN